MERTRLGPTSRLWPLGGQATVALVGLIGSTLTARWLGPSEFGNYFLALTVVSLVAIFVDVCAAQAVLTGAPGHATHAPNWRLLAVIIATIAALLTFAVASVFVTNGAGLLAWGLLCASIPFTSASLVPRALLIADHRLRFVSLVDMGSMIVATLLSLVAVGIAPLAASAAVSALLVAVARFAALDAGLFTSGKTLRPTLVRFRESIRMLWGAASGLYINQLAGFTARNGDNLIVSLALGAPALAQYSRAYSFIAGPVQQVQMALTPVFLRDFAKTIGDQKSSALALARTTKVLCFAMLPMVAAVGISGPVLVGWLLGPDWLGTASLSLWMSALCVSLVLALPARWMLLAQRNKRRLGIDALLQFATLAGCLFGAYSWGLQGAVAFNALVVSPIVTVALWMMVPEGGFRTLVTLVLPYAAFALLPVALSALACACLGTGSEWGAVFSCSTALITGGIGLLSVFKSAKRNSA